MTTANLESLFLDTLRDIYYAEHKITKALPKMASAAQSEDLKAAFEQHLAETEIQIERIEQIFERMGHEPEAKACAAMDGLMDEGEEVIATYKGTVALDAGLIAVAQAVEHYEIARYGTLSSWANSLGLVEVETLIEETLAEEMATNDALSDLAESSINEAAISDAA